MTSELITLCNVNTLQAIVVSTVTITIIILIVIIIVNVNDNFLNKDVEKIHPSQLWGFYCYYMGGYYNMFRS